jgi:tryptophanyl-tRNA synthetase
MKDVILTGIRSNAVPHIGNYLGAMLPMVESQQRYGKEYQMLFFVPDLHSFTTPVDHATLYENTIRNLKYFVAAGMDFWQDDAFLYRQSYIPAHSELTWILNCFTYFGEMRRMTQFKDKTGSNESNVTVGLFDYPVLMTADILLYGAKWVPVGEDQRQHLEISRDIAIRMNNKFGELFTVPEEWSKQLEFAKRDNGVRIRSLVNPEKKMSKSVSDPRGTILLSDDPDEASKKVMSATTDSEGSVHFDWEKQPGVTNLLQILALLSGKPQDEVTGEWEGRERYGELKSAVAEAVRHFLSDFQRRFNEVDEDALLQKLKQSEHVMNGVADHTLADVQRAIGLRPRD